MRYKLPALLLYTGLSFLNGCSSCNSETGYKLPTNKLIFVEENRGGEDYLGSLRVYVYDTKKTYVYNPNQIETLNEKIIKECGGLIQNSIPPLPIKKKDKPDKKEEKKKSNNSSLENELSCYKKCINMNFSYDTCSRKCNFFQK